MYMVSSLPLTRKSASGGAPTQESLFTLGFIELVNRLLRSVFLSSVFAIQLTRIIIQV